jgi:SAM-dependent methyltransferase
VSSPSAADRLSPGVEPSAATCPLCDSPRCAATAQIAPSVIETEYRRVYGIRVSLESPCTTLYRCERCQLGFFRPPSPGGEDFYRDLHRQDWYYMPDKPEYRFAAPFIGPSDSVLEVGGGEGAFARHLTCRSYRLLELNGAAVEGALRANLDALQEDVRDHAARNPGSYDVVCAFQVLEHIAEVRDFTAATVTALRPNGRLILSVPADDSFVGRDRRNVLNVPPHHVTRWRAPSLRALGERFGLDVERMHHESLTTLHVRAYAAAKADSLICLVARRRWQPVDPMLVRPGPRAARAALTAPMCPFVRLLRSRLRGHSITVVYRKP